MPVAATKRTDSREKNIQKNNEKITKVSCSAPTITFSPRRLREFPLRRKDGTSGPANTHSGVIGFFEAYDFTQYSAKNKKS